MLSFARGGLPTFAFLGLDSSRVFFSPLLPAPWRGEAAAFGALLGNLESSSRRCTSGVTKCGAFILRHASITSVAGSYSNLNGSLW